MANTILLKRSSTASSAPSAGQLAAGELAINTLDEKIFFKNSSGTVKSLSAMSDLTSNLVTIAGAQTISGLKTFSEHITLNAKKELRLADSDSSNYVAFTAASTVANNNVYTLPSAVGSANQVLQIASVVGNDATLQWATVSSGGTPGGSSTQVQFNDGGVFGGDAGLTYNKTTDTLTITGDLEVNGSDITTTGTGTATLFNTNALTLNLGGAATAVTMGAASGTTTTIRGGTLVGNTASQDVFNTTATTLNFGGAATTATIGYNSTAASTTNISTGAVAAATTKTVNIGTGGAASSTTNVNIGSSNGGTTTVNSATLVGAASTQAVFNTTATTVNAFGAATAMAIGNDATAAQTVNMFTASTGASTYNFATGATNFNTKTINLGTGGTANSTTNVNIGGPGTTTINSGTLVGSSTIQNVFNTTATSLNLGGAATTMAIGNTATAAQTVNMFTASTGASTYNFATGATGAATTKTVNIGTGGAASSTTNVNIGSSNGGTTTVNSGTLVGAATTQAVFNTTATTVNAFGAATALTVGDATASTITLRGGTLLGNLATQAVFNTTATTVNAFGAATSITMGATTGTTSVRNALRLGNTTASIATNTAAGTNHLTLAPFGNVVLAPNSTVQPTNGATFPVVTVKPGVGSTIEFTGGDVYLGTKSDDSFIPNISQVNLIWEGAVDNGFETTLTVAGPTTADQTITLPDATGTVALVAGSDTQVMFNDGGSALGGDAGLTYNKTTDSLTITGDLAVNGSDITTTSTGTATLFNTNATTVNIAGAGTTVSIGAATGTTTINNANTVVTGDLAVNGGDITTSAATATVFNTNATTVTAFGAATTCNLGPSGTSTNTTNIATAGLSAAQIKTVNIGTGATPNRQVDVNIGSWGMGSVNLTTNTAYIGTALDGSGTLAVSFINAYGAGDDLTISAATSSLWLESTTFAAIGDVFDTGNSTKITVDESNGRITLKSIVNDVRIDASNLLFTNATGKYVQFGDGSQQITKTPDFLLFNMGII